jgi:hypothetical protein
MKNDFHKDLKYSFSKKDFWAKVYKKAFSIMTGIVDLSDDKKAQAEGIDTIIKLPYGGILSIDEKMRRQYRPDVLIEYVSNDKSNSPGWIEKDLKIDFIAYAYMDINRVLFVPYNELKKLWSDNKEAWLKRYKIPPAKNTGYNTLNVAVPLEELRSLRIITVQL